ncbi:hypothetical protein CHISP_2078 [Chitinispirillum alkaliphilum]|nr:hypothetical protein CHISP_2078 [Chitinispirillum alkaliphilum]
MATKILITGATGPLGRKIVQYLTHMGQTVRAGVHNSSKTEYVKSPDVQIAHLDYRNFTTIDRALEGIKTLFLLTPIAREQVEYTRRMVDRARLWGVSHIVKLSMMGVDEVPGIQFTRLHKQSELYIRESDIPYTFIRPNAFMQNFLSYFQPAGSFIYLPMNGTMVSYIDLRDVARFCAEVLMHVEEFEGNIFELTGPESLSAEQVTEIMTKIVNHHINYINVSQDTAEHILESTGKPQWLAEGFVEYCMLQRTGRFSEVNTVYEEVLSKKPHTFEKFAHDYSTILKLLIQQEHHTFLK